MSDQAIDPRFESLLRGALAAEAASIPMRVGPDQIMERATVRHGYRVRSRLGLPRLSMAIAAGAAAVVLVVAGAVGLNFFVNQQRIGAPSPNPSPSPTTEPSVDLGIFEPVSGWIVYGTETGIWGDNPDGPDVKLAAGAGEPLEWSRDGTRLLVAGEHLFILHADGSETQMTERSMELRGATISPDGSRVVFVGRTGQVPGGAEGDCCTRWALYAVDADGGPAEMLLESRFGILSTPTFAPDGTQIAYVDGRGDWGHSVWLVDVDGSNAHQILANETTDGAGHARGLAWSPAGDRIALGLEGTTYTFAIDGSGFTRIGLGNKPYWSPDGSQIVSGPWHPGRSSGPTTEPSPPSVPIDDPPSPPPPVELRRDGEFIVFKSLGTGRGWDLAAEDPVTGEVRTIVETDGLVDCAERTRCTNFVRKAEWSADGRWVAFEVSNASLDGPPVGPCGPTVGIWVQGPNGAPRQLSTPCDAPPGTDDAVVELWEWSPVGAQLAYVRIDGETDELFVIDPSDGTHTSLVTGNIDPPYPVESESLAWSPDGSRIAYVDGSSVYAVDVDGGERSLLADSFEDTVDIAWSPNGTQLLVHDQGRYRIQVMNADGSNLHVVVEGEDACCETAWSPTGDRILYQISIPHGESPSAMWHSETWTVSPDGASPIKLFDSNVCGTFGAMGDTRPVWAPTGTQVAYRGCGGWVVENADGTGDVQSIDELVWRSWYSGGLTGGDLAAIGQIDH